MKTRLQKRYCATLTLITVIISLIILPLSHGAEEGIPRITIQELKKMMDDGEEVTVIDAQPYDIYSECHIKGAISIPWKSQLALEDVFALPGGVPIVTYCACGPGEADSADFARQLMQMGYNDVKVLKHPAIEGWIEAGYPVEKK
ncbi:MAG: rhodanese-like domain-containing protein [Deltaproteobacteria bacterium]|nr:rhodanese-like domain-containing protein [Deltaproteobacteria bacterium]